MELNQPNILAIFNKNFSFEIVSTPLGEAIKMPRYEAFLMSTVVGAGYFDNPVLPFTPKGLLKLFYNAFDYKFVTGIFEHTTLKNTPFNLIKAKPFLMDTEYKLVVPIAFDSEMELQAILENAFEKLPNPTNFIILRIEKSKKGGGMESLMEYLVATYFKQHGYIVENQIPLAHSLGSPDFGGYQLQETMQAVQPYFKNGFHIIELAMIRQMQPSFKSTEQEVSNHFIVGEAKTSTTNMTNQLLKYMNTALFDMGFEIHPAKTAPAKDFFGLFSLDKDFKINFHAPKNRYQPTANYDKKAYAEWLNNYMKFYVLANLTNDELNLFYQKQNEGKLIAKQSDLTELVKTIKINDILNGIIK